MVLIEQGTVEGGQLILPEAVDLPDGTKVRVYIEAIDGGASVGATEGADPLAAVFGAWADRADLTDSAAWVRKLRDSWPSRSTPH